jgi:CDP-diacylglycerol---glycerol-3-phosphate 3-phosphatidyltransferase
MWSDRLRDGTQSIRAPIGRFLGGLGITPNALTVLGYFLHLPAALVLSRGSLTLGGVLFLLASLLDSLDGSVAREMDQVTTFGAFLDSVTDRFSEATILLGLLLWYLGKGSSVEVVLIYVATVGSLMVSYTRARAEGVGVQCKQGLFTRLERVVLLGLGLIVRQATITLWILAILTVFTALQRVRAVWQSTRALTKP